MQKPFLQRILMAGCLLLFVTSVILLFALPKRVISPDHERAVKGVLNEHLLYSTATSEVYLRSGDLLSLDRPGNGSGAIAISTKFDLAEPFWHDSLDDKVRELFLKDQVTGNALNKSLEALRNDLPVGARRRGYWVALLPETLLVSGWRVLLLAGIPARPTTGEEPKLLTEMKPGIIEGGVEHLVSHAQAEGIGTLAIPLIGTGAAGLDDSVAIRAILRGINAAVVRHSAPSRVVVVLYPQGESMAEKTAYLSNLSRVFHITLTASEGDVWTRRRLMVALAQMCFLLVFPMLAGLVALRDGTLPVVLGAGPIVGNTMKWSLIGAGFFSIGQQSPLMLEPLPLFALVVMCTVGFLMPLWEWYELGKAPERKGIGDTA